MAWLEGLSARHNCSSFWVFASSEKGTTLLSPFPPQGTGGFCLKYRTGSLHLCPGTVQPGSPRPRPATTSEFRNPRVKPAHHCPSPGPLCWVPLETQQGTLHAAPHAPVLPHTEILFLHALSSTQTRNSNVTAHKES